MLIRRFDRHWAHPEAGLAPDERPIDTAPGAGKTEHRLGFVSGLTLVARDEAASAGSTYGELAAAVRGHRHPSVILANNAELFRQMVFNILATNDDDPLRSHGFVFDPRLPGWRLSPGYDLTPQPRIGSERLLRLGVGPRGREASLDNALTGCAQFTLSVPDAAGIVSDVWRIVRQWRTWFDEFGVAPQEQDQVASAFRHIDDISSPDTRRLLD